MQKLPLEKNKKYPSSDYIGHLIDLIMEFVPINFLSKKDKINIREQFEKHDSAYFIERHRPIEKRIPLVKGGDYEEDDLEYRMDLKLIQNPFRRINNRISFAIKIDKSTKAIRITRFEATH